MTFQITVDNPNGSSSLIQAKRLYLVIRDETIWNWEEISNPCKYLGDDDHDRVEEELLNKLGDADDWSDEAVEARQKYWVPANKFGLKAIEANLEETLDIINQYF